VETNTKFKYIIEECQICGGKAYIYDQKRMYKDGEETLTSKQCSCLKKAVDYHRFDLANIPREFFDYTLNDFKETTPEKVVAKEKVEHIIANIKNYHREGRGLFLYGTKGTGKTMLAMEILKGASRQGFSTYYDFYPLIFEDFTKKGFKSDDYKKNYDNIFKNTDFLVLDELFKEADYFNGSQNQAASARFLEMNILKRRASKPTIIISNVQNGLEDIKSHYGQYVYSMMKHTYDLMSFTDHDFREAGR
jgi:DNA replication protein DnaC